MRISIGIDIAILTDELNALDGAARIGLDVTSGIAGLAAARLVQAGFRLVHVPGIAVDRARQDAVGGENKSDPRDAPTSADQVRTRPDLRPAEAASRLEALLRRHPDAALIRSLPGLGVVLAAELTAEAGNLARLRFANAFASVAGMAPVLRQSSRTRFFRRRIGGNKGLKRVFCQSACSLAHDNSRTFCQRKRREGKRRRQAVITLARRRVNVL